MNRCCYFLPYNKLLPRIVSNIIFAWRTSHGCSITVEPVLVRIQDCVGSFGRLWADPILDAVAKISGIPVTEVSFRARIFNRTLGLANVAEMISQFYIFTAPKKIGCFNTQLFFNKWAIPGLFLNIFGQFQIKTTIFTTNQGKNCLSSIWCWDSYPRSSKH